MRPTSLMRIIDSASQQFQVLEKALNSAVQSTMRSMNAAEQHNFLLFLKSNRNYPYVNPLSTWEAAKCH